MSASRWLLTEHAPLRSRNTFGVAAQARYLLQVADLAALPEALALPAIQGQPLLPIGAGSNLLLAGDLDGVALGFDARRIDLLEDDEAGVRVRAEAGVVWHALVLWTLSQGAFGLENLALIPGTVGACAIQNIGAYGVEVGEHIDSVEAWDTRAADWCRLSRAECAFGYRDSVFKRQSGRWIITAVTFALSRVPDLRLDYAGLRAELDAMGVAEPGPAEVAQAVIRVRSRKLPDPAVLGNAGSFFKNPIVPATLAERLAADFPGLPVFPGDAQDTRKLSAAWLIERAGWKGQRDGDAGVSPDHALVLVNHGGASGAQLLALARRIAASVQARFGVAIEPEPRIVGAAW
ncbi:UDP-N-acetylmuramate dehydrogenase [Pseudoxanthomonas winnipegensis]|uniref:UDP-N-acetylenolpyruvoylglucosamine reductase n=1 Tax=Pseudoxanthomonas winnipegensis TaxID=2480810 RepID=A0A4Q8LF13_9GAMM|nr:UDP-N-acetylmuramate dehydrogenase [Pseudoxanthomonas winnipegensis]RZZ88849.1 UDP-N-acetylmuramate dehydrogenase [Pseudoxanthomonas winnipegensis]TAA27441.1 UDP-N-acetylmuramate dehydrogenase [Pseudoxanthomonas winnipegensis]TAA39052.1 UDP-N-acetylmuramate dehydrogenase [Pseudoxanthomonas winnipegensis]TBV71360.1 UDP-N-acetylmuramate dehydrogenase [Pseudoxanthomonas winnipegensis]